MITDKFNFVHLPRTGGTTTHHIIKKSGAVILDGQNHMPHIEELTIRNQPSFIIIRNPFEWYQSWHSWLGSARRLDLAYESYKQPYKQPFDSYLEDVFKRRKKHRMTRVVPYDWYGSFSACWNYFASAQSLSVFRYENLHAELPSILAGFGGIPEQHTKRLLGTYLRRTNNHPKYTPALVKMVEEMDGYMLDKYGYEPS